MLISLLIPILGFFFQSYPRFFNKFFGVDVWTRMLEIDHVRKNKHKIPQQKIAGQFIIPGYFDYPPVFPTMLSFIPKKILFKYQGFISPFFDNLQTVLIYFIAFYLTGNIYLSLLAQLFYILTPMIAIENSSLTPRSLGYLNFSLTTLFLIFFIFQGAWWWFLLALIANTFLFLTHRFAIQSFFFLSIFMAIYLRSLVFPLSFLLSFFLALILTKGYYLRVLKGHLYNIYFWVKNLDYRWSHQIRGMQKKKVKTDWVGKLYNFMSVFSPFAMFGLNPWSASAFILFFAHYFGYLHLSSLLLTFLAWVMFFYFLGAAVMKTKKLMPIGEGYRYMEMATVPSVILSAFIFFEILKTPHALLATIFLILFLLFLLFLILTLQIKGVVKDKNRSVGTELEKVFKYINKMKTAPRVLCIPHQNTTMTIFNSKAQVFVNADNPGLIKVQEVYPVLKKPLSVLAKKYNLTHVLLKESFATLKELKLGKKKVLFQSGDIKLIAI